MRKLLWGRRLSASPRVEDATRSAAPPPHRAGVARAIPFALPLADLFSWALVMRENSAAGQSNQKCAMYVLNK